MPNTEKQMTACQMLIEELEQLKPLSKLMSSDVVKGLDIAIEQVKLKLATERQQLIDFGSDCIGKSKKSDLFETKNIAKQNYVNTFKPQ